MHGFAIEMRGRVAVSTSGSFRSVNKGSIASIGGSFNFVGIAFWISLTRPNPPCLVATRLRDILDFSFFEALRAHSGDPQPHAHRHVLEIVAMAAMRASPRFQRESLLEQGWREMSLSEKRSTAMARSFCM